jgi:hypothetical protein
MNSRLLFSIPDGAIRGIKEYNHYIGRGLVADACFHLQTWLHRPHEGFRHLLQIAALLSTATKLCGLPSFIANIRSKSATVLNRCAITSKVVLASTSRIGRCIN